jgi:Lrp/AsnC family leucine-responsive transcriptional regulator
MSLDLDDIDRAILRALRGRHAQGLRSGATRRPVAAGHLAAGETPDRGGVIGGRRLDLDLEALGFGVTVFLGVKLATKGRVSLEDFERAVSAIPEVQTVEHVLGLYDYRLRVVARDLPDFERVLRAGS